MFETEDAAPNRIPFGSPERFGFKKIVFRAWQFVIIYSTFGAGQA
jgi:hypothetical protein